MLVIPASNSLLPRALDAPSRMEKLPADAQATRPVCDKGGKQQKEGAEDRGRIFIEAGSSAPGNAKDAHGRRSGGQNSQATCGSN